jgi:hypothetical protein
MNSRQRILSAINHRQPDRIPVDLGATPVRGYLRWPIKTWSITWGLTLKTMSMT